MNPDHPCHDVGVDPESRTYPLTAGDRANATAWRQEDQGGQPPPGGARPRAKGDPAKRLSESVPKPALRHPWPDPAAPGRGRHAAGVPRPVNNADRAVFPLLGAGGGNPIARRAVSGAPSPRG